MHCLLCVRVCVTVICSNWNCSPTAIADTTTIEQQRAHSHTHTHNWGPNAGPFRAFGALYSLDCYFLCTTAQLPPVIVWTSSGGELCRIYRRKRGIIAQTRFLLLSLTRDTNTHTHIHRREYSLYTHTDRSRIVDAIRQSDSDFALAANSFRYRQNQISLVRLNAHSAILFLSFLWQLCRAPSVSLLQLVNIFKVQT